MSEIDNTEKTCGDDLPDYTDPYTRLHWNLQIAERQRDEAIDSALMFERDWKDACRERDEAREAMREAWFAMDETDGTERMIEWQNKNANILEGAK